MKKLFITLLLLLPLTTYGAIAFDAATDGDFSNSATSHTFSHTTTGSDLILFVHAGHNADGDIITGATYNGVSMTEITNVSPDANRREYLFYLLNPATGANDVVISSSASTAIFGNAASYTGAKQSGQPDASTSTTTTTTTMTANLTTVADNSWSIYVTTSGDSVTSTAGANSTLRVTNTTFGDSSIFDSNGAITPAGSFSMTVNPSATNPTSGIMASFAPAEVAVTNKQDIIWVY